MSLFPIADKVHKRQGSALTQAKGNLKDAGSVIRDLSMENERLTSEVSRLKLELANVRRGFDANVVSFSLELEKRTGFVREFPDKTAALEFFSQAIEARKAQGALNPGEFVDSWRQRQL